MKKKVIYIVLDVLVEQNGRMNIELSISTDEILCFRMGLAISFVSTVSEKVWYHTCPSKGKNCHNTRLVDQNGCCKWYTEMTYLADIEEHLGMNTNERRRRRRICVCLGVTVAQTDEKMDVPVDEFDGKVTYGEKRKQEGKVEYCCCCLF